MKNEITIETIKVGQLQTNCYLIINRINSEVIIVDPGDDSNFIAQYINENHLKPTSIVATHGHFDHILGIAELQLIFKIPFLLNKKDEFLVKQMKNSGEYFLKYKILELIPKVDKFVDGNDKLILGKHLFSIIEAPGHTPGSIVIRFNNQFLITGDVLFIDGVGRTDFSYCSKADLETSLQKIYSLPSGITLYPGHGESFKLGKLGK